MGGLAEGSVKRLALSCQPPGMHQKGNGKFPGSIDDMLFVSQEIKARFWGLTPMNLPPG
jgi:hypothetical protein